MDSFSRYFMFLGAFFILTLGYQNCGSIESSKESTASHSSILDNAPGLVDNDSLD